MLQNYFMILKNRCSRIILKFTQIRGYKMIYLDFSLPSLLVASNFNFLFTFISPPLLVKNLPGVLETWIWSLCWEDTLEKGKAPLQYSGLENSMDCIVHGVAKSWTRLRDFPFPFPMFCIFYIVWYFDILGGLADLGSNCLSWVS